jgi:murein L,D-transpeptidase YcbB/YkuD
MDRIQKSMNGSNTSTIQLKKRYPVYIEYRTAWVDENNEVIFREDIYGHDKHQLQLLYPMEKVSSTMARL